MINIMHCLQAAPVTDKNDFEYLHGRPLEISNIN